jgi:hypothetical protein
LKLFGKETAVTIVAVESRAGTPTVASRIKATLAQALRRAIDARMRRIQFEIDFHSSIERGASEYAHPATNNTRPQDRP